MNHLNFYNSFSCYKISIQLLDISLILKKIHIYEIFQKKYKKDIDRATDFLKIFLNEFLFIQVN